MFIEKMKPFCCAEIVLTQKLYNVKHCKERKNNRKIFCLKIHG
jgi:hypothetical protein